MLDLWLIGWWAAFYGISTFVGFLMPNQSLYNSISNNSV